MLLLQYVRNFQRLPIIRWYLWGTLKFRNVRLPNMSSWIVQSLNG